MSDAKINLVAAILVLLAAIAPMFGKVARIAIERGVARTVASMIVVFFALCSFGFATYGRWFGGQWSPGLVCLFLWLFIILSAISFSIDSTAPRRFEIALFVVQIATVMTLIASEIERAQHNREPPTHVELEEPSPSN